LSARRLGWRFTAYDTLRTEQGASIPLTTTSPTLLAKFLRDAVQRRWQRQMATSLSDEGWAGSRVCPDPIVCTLKSAWARAHRLEAHNACKAFCNAVWTGERAAGAGYDCEGLMCPLCGEELDTLEHRILRCRSAASKRGEHKRAFDEIKAGYNSDKLFFTRGIWRHPADRLPRPPSTGEMIVTWPSETRQADRDLSTLSGGLAFCDGSASRHSVVELRRAAWAVVFTDLVGTVRASISGPVWEHLPQTPQAAEYASTVAAIQLLCRPTHVIGDCLGVVNAVQKLKREGVPRGVHAGLLKDSAVGGNLCHVTDASWMPSHRALGPDATPQQKVWHDGNDNVDKEAGEARLLEERRTGAAELDDAEATCRQAVRALKAVGSVLALWPALPRAMARKVHEPVVKLSLVHDWQFSQHHQYWRCKSCGVFAHGPEAKGPPDRHGRCQPGRLLERHNKAEQLGHQMDVVCVNGTPTHYCTLCAARGTWQWRKLLDQCNGCPRSAVERRWLEAARDGGLELQAAHLQARPKRRPNRNPPRDKTKSRKGNGTPRAKDRATDALRNRKTATRDDSLRWASLDGGLCQAVCLPSLPRFGEDAGTSRPDSSSSRPSGPPQTAPTLLLLQPFFGRPRRPG